ncbi:hypothetical protein ACQCSU_02885 [Pseudarthrobacter sp. O4]|uniref:hypothetical protein n=1 Tax=Pseudarthrobacter sp. O4 TaxID=3418417 RepID=UPI003CE7AAB8
MRSAGPRAGRRGALDFCDDRFQFLELGNFCLHRGHEETERGADPVHEARARDVVQEVLEDPEPDHQQRDDSDHRAEAEHHYQVDAAGVQHVPGSTCAGRGIPAAGLPDEPPDRAAGQERTDPRQQERADPGTGQRRRRHGEGSVDDHPDTGGGRHEGDAGGHESASLPGRLSTPPGQSSVVDPDKRADGGGGERRGERLQQDVHRFGAVKRQLQQHEERHSGAAQREDSRTQDAGGDEGDVGEPGAQPLPAVVLPVPPPDQPAARSPDEGLQGGQPPRPAHRPRLDSPRRAASNRVDMAPTVPPTPITSPRMAPSTVGASARSVGRFRAFPDIHRCQSHTAAQTTPVARERRHCSDRPPIRLVSVPSRLLVR